MPHFGTEILVIGGGATGLGVAYDAAQRGFKTLLLEKGDLAHGTTGRHHGLLHSGARYAVRDPQAARECLAENRVLRRIMPQAIEDTGGLFVHLPGDPSDYPEAWLAACAQAGIPVAEISPAEALRAEPLLNPNLLRAFRIPDAAIDPFDALHMLQRAARSHGGLALTRHRVTRLVVENGAVVGAEAENLITGEGLRVTADLVINCAGPWAGQIAALAGCNVEMRLGKGTLLAMNMRLVNTVINRCRPPGDADLIVPIGAVAIIGTTDIPVPDPDRYDIGDDEIELMLAQGEQIIPTFQEYRALRAWAGVRPLFEETALTPASGAPSPAPTARERGTGGEGSNRWISRAHAILDHETRDGVRNFLSVVGGKFTTFRLMAEQAVDAAAKKLGAERSCRTAQEPLEARRSFRYHTLPERMQEIESRTDAPEIICECELVTRAQVEAAIRESQSPILNDLRRDLRLGMGPCQATFCAYRAAALTPHPLPSLPSPETGEGMGVRALSQFLQERWKGLRPVMWGHSLRQLELDLAVYRGLFALDGLPAAREVETYPTEKTA